MNCVVSVQKEYVVNCWKYVCLVINFLFLSAFAIVIATFHLCGTGIFSYSDFNFSNNGLQECRIMLCLLQMRIVDLIAFSTLPALFVARSILVKALNERLPEVLQKIGHHLLPPQLQDSPPCTIVERENVSFSRLVFPAVILFFELNSRFAGSPMFRANFELDISIVPHQVFNHLGCALYRLFIHCLRN